jgi:hypothetical protein
VHGHGPHALGHAAGLPAQRLALEEVAEVALGVDLADKDPLALLAREEGEGGSDRRLADTALAGDEQDAAVEQVADL